MITKTSQLKKLNDAMAIILDCLNYPKSNKKMAQDLTEASELLRSVAEELQPFWDLIQ